MSEKHHCKIWTEEAIKALNKLIQIPFEKLYYQSIEPFKILQEMEINHPEQWVTVTGLFEIERPYYLMALQLEHGDMRYWIVRSTWEGFDFLGDATTFYLRLEHPERYTTTLEDEERRQYFATIRQGAKEAREHRQRRKNPHQTETELQG